MGDAAPSTQTPGLAPALTLVLALVAAAALAPGVPKNTHSRLARTVRKRTRTMATAMRAREKEWWRVIFGMAMEEGEALLAGDGGNDEWGDWVADGEAD